MPTGPLEVRCQQVLEDIVIISQQIRSSALRYANNQEDNKCLSGIEDFRRQLETIRRSADAVLEAITLQNRIIDEKVFTWLFSGKLHPCLDRLKEVDDVVKFGGVGARPAVTSALPLVPTADIIMRAIALFERHKDMFCFLLTPAIWDSGIQQLPQPNTLLRAEEMPQDAQETTIQNSTEQDCRCDENAPRPEPDREATRQKAFLDQKLDEVSRWLAALDCTDKQNETLKQRQPGTCTWFPNTGAYKVWRSGRSPFLWLHGKGGCGKSVLVASTIEHLESTLEDGDVLVYYYCDFRNERSTSPAEVMRSLLSQLFRHFRDCGIDAGALPNRILEEKRDGALTLNDVNQMAHLVLRAAGRFPREPMILIDALDECAELEKFLFALSTLMYSHIRLLVTSRPLEILKKHFEKYPSLSFHAMGKELAADIWSHITQELYSHAQLSCADIELKDQIREKLCEKADGRFRWVQCQLDTLKRCSSQQELQEVLSNLPGELEMTYERILAKIDERTPEANLVRRALVWLIAALEPLRLSQLLDGLSFDPRERKIHCGTQSLRSTLLDGLSSLVLYNQETDVLALSHLTVKEYLTSRTALPMYRIIPHEAHIEVAEMCMFYITSLLKQVRFRASLAVSKSSPMLSYVFSTGLNHLAYADPTSSVVLGVLQSFASEVNRHPSHWDLLCEMREEDPRRFYPPWPSSRHDVTLYTLIAYSPVGLLESFLSRNRPLKPRPGTNPLVYAADLWKTTHATTLLEGSVDATVPGLVVDDSRHALPLEIAVDLGNETIVGELLQRGSVATPELLSTAVCMPWCSARVLVKLVQTDAFTEWAHEIGDEELYRAIFNSARPNAGDNRQADRDYVALARRLRELGQNLAPDSLFGAELVERALNAAHISMLEFLLPPDQPPPARFLITACTGNTSETVSVVRFLLDKKINIHAVSRGRRDTALHLAALSPWEPRALELTKILLDAGCNLGTQNRRREMPLTIAVRRGYITLVEHLLSRNASLPSHILLLALQKRRRPQMIGLLLRGGANIKARTASRRMGIHLAVMSVRRVSYEKLQDEEHTVGRVARELRHNPRHAALQNDECEQDNETVDDPWDWYEDENSIYGPCEEYQEAECLELVKLLVGSGSNPNSYDGKGWTAVEIAMSRKYTSVVEYLLTCNFLSLPPNILLTAMKKSCSPKLVKRLVHAGAKVHASNRNAILLLAVTNYKEPSCLRLVKILLKACCDPTVLRDRGERILKVLTRNGYSSVVEYLLSCGILLPPDILTSGLQRHSISHLELAKLLFWEGADVHLATDGGDTVLHLTMSKYEGSLHLDLHNIFMKGRRNRISYGFLGRMVLELAIQEGCTSLVEHLLSCGVPLPPDILLTVLQHPLMRTLDIATLLVCKGANVQFMTCDGDTVLHLTMNCCKGPLRLDLLKVFIEAGCDPTSYGSQGRTILELAIQEGCASLVEHLLSCGVLLPPDILLTVLQHHLMHSLEIATLLVRRGANVHFATPDGDTVLHLTTTHYKGSMRLGLLKIFIKAGCNPNSCNSEGKAVLMIAIDKGYTPVVALLLSAHRSSMQSPGCLSS